MEFNWELILNNAISTSIAGIIITVIQYPIIRQYQKVIDKMEEKMKPKGEL